MARYATRGKICGHRDFAVSVSEYRVCQHDKLAPCGHRVVVGGGGGDRQLPGRDMLSIILRGKGGVRLGFLDEASCANPDGVSKLLRATNSALKNGFPVRCGNTPLVEMWPYIKKKIYIYIFAALEVAALLLTIVLTEPQIYA